MKLLTAVLAVVVVVALPALSEAQTVTVQAEATVPPPPAQTAPQGQVVVQPQPYVQPQPQPYVQPQPYYQPTPVQPQPQPQTRQRPIWGLVISGAVMLGVSWIIHAAVISPFAGWSATSGFQSNWGTFRGLGAVPVLGPWLQMAVKPTGFEEDDWAGYLILDGVLQAAGLTMLILGVTLQETETYYADGDADPEAPSFAVTPTAGPDGAGLAAMGRF